MTILRQALGLLGKARSPQPRVDRGQFQAALERMHIAQLQMKEASTLEQLDVGRAAYLAAQAEVQFLIRAAKQDQGLKLRPLAETEAIHRRLQERLQGAQRAGERRRRA